MPRTLTRNLPTDLTIGLLFGLGTYLAMDNRIPLLLALAVPAVVFPAVGVVFNAVRRRR